MSFAEILAIIGTIGTIISVTACLYFNNKSKGRADTSEIEKKATEMASINVKLDNIDKNVSDIKFDVNSTKRDVQSLTERVVAVEQSTKQAHHRIDGIENK